MQAESIVRQFRILTFIIPALILAACGQGDGPQSIRGTAATPLPPIPPGFCDNINFEALCPPATIVNFNGGATTVIDNPDMSGINTSDGVAQMQKFPDEVFGGTKFDLPVGIDFADGEAYTVKVWSPRPVEVSFKLEETGNPAGGVTIPVNHTGSGTWEELCFDFTGQTAGIPSPPVQALTIIFDNGTLGQADTNPMDWTFYYDDVIQVASCPGGPGPGPGTFSTITFDDPAVSYTLTGFGGAEDSTVIADPADPANSVVQVNRAAGAEVFAGTTVSTGANNSIPPIPLDASNTQMTVRVFSQAAGIPVRLKIENAADPTTSVETEATTTMAGVWETLTFDFANEVSGTAAFDPAATYNKVTIFFNFGAAGAPAETYLFDDIDVGSGGGTGPGTFSTITFDDPAITYTLTGFGGAEDSTVVPSVGLSNFLVQVNRAAGAEVFAGTTVSTGANNSVPTIPLDAGNTQMNVRVISALPGIQVRLKIENASDPTVSVETEATTTTSGVFETLTFDFANQVSGTAAFDPAATYNKITIFFNFGAAGAPAQTYFFDDIAVGAGPGGGTGGSSFDPITFDDSAVTYSMTGFGGAEDSTVVVDPTDPANMVGRVVKSATAELWAGTTVSTGANESIPTIPLDAANTQMSVRVWSPDAGIQVRLKVEDASDPTVTVETEATTTMAGAWETLTFDFVNPAAGTAAFDPAATYNKVSIFFNFGVTGATAGEKTYYFDDIDFVAGTGGGGGGTGGGSAPTSTDFEGAGPFNFSDFDGGVAALIPNPDATGINTSATVGQMQKFAGQPWGGSTLDLGADVDWSSGEVYTMKVRSQRVVDVLFKLEGLNQERTATHGGTGWELLCFDFTGATGGAPATAITLIFDNGTMGDAGNADPAIAADWTFQFDDIEQVASCPGGGGTGGGTFAPITFDDPAITYTLTDFGGNSSTVTNDPAGGSNMVVQAVKSNTAELWAGTTVSTEANDAIPTLPLDAANTQMTVRVWSPDAGIQVRLKIENASDPTVTVETEATTTMAGAWETLTFDFASPAAGTAAFNPAATYNKVSIFFNFGVTGATAGEKTYYFDDIEVGSGSGGGGTGGSSFDPITFDDSAVTYSMTGFGGAEDSTVVVDPTDPANMVGQVVKSATAELWAGTTVSTGANESIATIPLDAANTQMSVRVWSPDAGIQVRLKVEDASDPTVTVETEATTTMAGAWETLTFDFANPAAGTAAFNPAATYNKVSIFFNFGVTGATAGEKTYYFDDIDFGAGTGGGGGGTGGGGSALITFDDSAVTYSLSGFGGAEASSVITDPTDATNMVAEVVKSNTAELWAGTTVSTGANESIPTLPLAVGNTQMSVRVWTPNSGIQVRLKVETAGDPTRSVETEATTTMSGQWHTLTFDFANQAAGTAAFDPTYTYNKISIFFNFGVDGASGGGGTYYFDDIDLP